MIENNINNNGKLMTVLKKQKDYGEYYSHDYALYCNMLSATGCVRFCM
jgi:hypothetical protein